LTALVESHLLEAKLTPISWIDSHDHDDGRDPQRSEMGNCHFQTFFPVTQYRGTVPKKQKETRQSG